MINRFENKYFFLSNYYNSPVYYNNFIFENAEAAFHAQKTKNKIVQYQFTELDPASAKKLGRKIELREDWETVKEQIMYEIVKNKFRNSKLRQLLLETKDEELVEGNWWHDEFWGADINTGKGKNKLGKILMKVREELKNGTNS